jgi:2-keto-4-pentenoate hydratase
MSTATSVEGAADRLWEAWQAGAACPPVRDLIGAENIDAAYQVQRRNEARMIAAGDRVVGRKIGLTSEAVQSQLGVDQPDFGPLFASRRVADGGAVDLAAMISPRIEAEIALVLGAELDDPAMTVDDLRAATTHAVAALEVVDSRVQGWDITIADTVADFASGAAFVLGAVPRPIDDGLDLAMVPMTMWRDGVEVCTGVGAASLGDPLKAALWLARTLADRGTPLAEGDVVMTGALGPFVEIAPGQTIRADLGPLGSVSCTIERSIR